ncbi:MAG: DEAD/DEAH box helicase family protein [Pseudomonadota bacterium]
MSASFFEAPILNSPYAYPAQHWHLNDDGQPTDIKLPERRPSKLITPVPKSRKRRGKGGQTELGLDSTEGLSDETQEYAAEPIVNDIRRQVDEWRKLPSPDQWGVTPQTARLLQHWRSYGFQGIRPFFCQVEAVETAIWLAEVAPRSSARGKPIWQHLDAANKASNPDLFRIALKLATGAGKTTVMAMLIAWQTVNSVRQPDSKRYSKGFLIVAPGITIKDRLRVLLPNDPESYYRERELVPPDMLNDIASAKIVITNYHAFKRREQFEGASGTRRLLKGRGPELRTLETEGQMLQRVAGDLMGMKNIVVINDEAHHCYREKPETEEEKALKGEDRKEAEKNKEAARLWISGLEIAKKKLGVHTVYDLSATPFFLRGSGYVEGTLFPWVVSDFSLMDAIECGIVKLPRVPVAQNIPMGDMPMYRELWDHIGKKMPKKGRGKGGAAADPHNLPMQLQTALDALYGHYEKTFEVWQEAKIEVPPVFIVVCNNTATSKLVFDYIAGFRREHEDGTSTPEKARLPLFSNYDQFDNPLPRPNTLLIDSEQLESGEALDKNFRDIASDEIDQFKREIVERSGDQRAADSLTDADILREVMNTVGKPGRLGAGIRCVVSVSMLTEGWDANTVTHILGVRAFGTQLLCEQVVGRGLRRQSYDLNEDGLFNAEYADILGIPFDFTAAPVVSKPVRPKPTIRVHAVSPARDHLEIRFPRVEGYRTELPKERLTAAFTDAHRLELTPDLVGPTVTRNQGIIGEAVDLTVEHLENVRKSQIIFEITNYILQHRYRDPGEPPKLHLFGQMKGIVRQWLDGGLLTCTGETNRGQLLYREITEMVADRIQAAVTASTAEDYPVKAILDPYNPTGSTSHVSFTTSKETRWDTAGPPPKCHLNWIMLDSDWEAEFCRVAERHPRVSAYVKNHALGFEIPYRRGSQPRRYLPDFILRVDDGRKDPLNLIVEISGYPKGDKQDKVSTVQTYWLPGINALGTFGRWEFVEFTDVYEIEKAFSNLIEQFVLGKAA